MYESPVEREVSERFTRDTKDHQLTILHDNGLYRHLMFRQPDTGCYWFELITTPNSLTFQGDGTAFTFRRLHDMFQFFRSSAVWDAPRRVNAHYWAEKVVSQHAPVYGCLQEFSEESFNEQVAEELKEAEQEHPGVTAAWKKETEGSWPDWDTHCEDGAREALRDFRFDKFRFEDTYEWNLRDWDWWYLWACHAIVWGIGRYDAAKTEQAATAARRRWWDVRRWLGRRNNDTTT